METAITSNNHCPHCGTSAADWLCTEIGDRYRCARCAGIVRSVDGEHLHKYATHAAEYAWHLSMDCPADSAGSVDALGFAALVELDDSERRQYVALGGSMGARWVVVVEDSDGFVDIADEYSTREALDCEATGWAAQVAYFDPTAEDDAALTDPASRHYGADSVPRVLDCTHSETLRTDDGAAYAHISHYPAADLAPRHCVWPMTVGSASPHQPDMRSWSFMVNVPSEAPDSAHHAFLVALREAWSAAYGADGFGPYAGA